MKRICALVALVALLTSCSSGSKSAGWNGELLFEYQVGLFRGSDRLTSEVVRERLVIISGSGTVDNGSYIVSISGLGRDAGEWSYSRLAVTPHAPIEFEADGVRISYAGEELRGIEDKDRRPDVGTWVTIGAWSDESRERTVSLRRMVAQFEEASPGS